MTIAVVALRKEAELKIQARGRVLTEELQKRRYSLREFMEYVGINPKSTSYARNIVLGITQPQDVDIARKIEEFLEAVCPTCGCKCPPRKAAKVAAKS